MSGTTSGAPSGTAIGLTNRALSGSPLRQALARVDAGNYYFGLEPSPSRRSFETVDSLTRDGGAALALRVEQARSKWSLSLRDAALFTIGTYAWRVGGPAIACYVLSRRVPDIAPANLALAFDGDGGLSEVALRGGRFAALPQDSAADHPGALVLADEAALLGWMRGRLEAGIEPLIEAARGHVRLGRRAAWRWACDYVAQAFLMVGWDTGDQAGYAADAAAFVGSPQSPLKSNTRFFVVEKGGRRGAYAVRGVCCQAYKEPGQDNCDSCPMLPQDELERRALADLATRG